MDTPTKPSKKGRKKKTKQAGTTGSAAKTAAASTSTSSSTTTTSAAAANTTSSAATSTTATAASASSSGATTTNTDIPKAPGPGRPRKPAAPKKKYKKLTAEEKALKKAASLEAKKLKKAKTAKAKPKAPVDIEKQCGVALPNGGFCARSLTCKTHSMGAKRAVQGRSRPYDVLLAAYQKRNQIKLAEMSNMQQMELENKALGHGPVKEEEEIEQVMRGVMMSRPVPMETRVLMPALRRQKFLRMREMMIGSLTKVGPVMLQGADEKMQVMTKTSSFLGRAVVIDQNGNKSMRPSRAYLNTYQRFRQQQAQAQSQGQQQAQQMQAQQSQGGGG